MRAALRRLLTLLPIYLLLGLVVFRFGPEAPAALELPNFFEPRPRDVRDRAREAAALARTGEDPTRAATELTRLGVAALPHVLPELDAAPSDERLRVVRALRGIAKRAELATPDELADDASALGFWTRYWRDRGPELRGAVVERAVSRLAERSLVSRRTELRELDTLALPALIAELDRADRLGDVARARRLSLAAAHASGNDWVVPREGQRAELRRIARLWRVWWVEHRAEFELFAGRRRVLASLTETRFGRFVERTRAEGFGVDGRGRERADLLAAAVPGTAGRVLGALTASLVLGLGLGWVLATQLARAAEWSVTPAVVFWTPLVGALLVGGAPASWLAPIGIACGLAGGLALDAAHEIRREMATEPARAEAGRGARPSRLAIHGLRRRLAGLLFGLEPLLATVLVLAVEPRIGVAGVGGIVVEALREGATATLLALAGLAVLVGSMLDAARDALAERLGPLRLHTTRRARRLLP